MNERYSNDNGNNTIKNSNVFGFGCEINSISKSKTNAKYSILKLPWSQLLSSLSPSSSQNCIDKHSLRFRKDKEALFATTGSLTTKNLSKYACRKCRSVANCKCSLSSIKLFRKYKRCTVLNDASILSSESSLSSSFSSIYNNQNSQTISPGREFFKINNKNNATNYVNTALAQIGS